MGGVRNKTWMGGLELRLGMNRFGNKFGLRVGCWHDRKISIMEDGTVKLGDENNGKAYIYLDIDI